MINSVIWNGEGQKLATIYVGPNESDSILYNDVLLYLSYLTDVSTDDITSKYCLKKGKTFKVDQTCINDGSLKAGHHVIIPKSQEDSELSLIPLLNMSKLFPPCSRKSTPPTSVQPSPPSLSLSMASLTNSNSSSAHFGAEYVPVERFTHYSQFTLSLALRDRRCIVSKVANPNLLVGAHIIPYSWKQNQYRDLPADLREILLTEYDEMGVNDIRNGALMESSIHTAFDKQYWSVIWDKDVQKWRVVAMTKECPSNIIGRFLTTPDPGETDNGKRYEDCFINPEFLKYHLKTAVFRYMQGGGQDDEDYDEPMNKVIKVWSDEIRFQEYVYSGGDISSAMNV